MNESVRPPPLVGQDHLCPLAAGWSVWRSICVRGAGFPVVGVLRLAASRRTGDQVDRVIDSEARLAHVADAAAKLVANDLAQAVDQPRHVLAGVLKKLRAHVIPPNLEGVSVESRTAIERMARALEELAHERAVGLAALADDHIAIDRELRRCAADPRFREAVTWQNAAAVKSSLDTLLRQPEGLTNSKVRQKYRMISMYVQRYCTKNDSIGFFGPIGWASANEGDFTVRTRPGTGLVDVRQVSFEYWAIDTLANRLASDLDLRLSIAPRRMPTIRLDGPVVHYPIAQSTTLDPPYAAVLAACDGETPARELIRSIAANRALEVTEAEVQDMLFELVELRMVTWTLEIPTSKLNPLNPAHTLRRLLEALVPSDARARALAELAELEAARDEVAAATGDAEKLDPAMAALGELFARKTGSAATRNAGQVYTARTLIYEDTRRDISIELGSAFWSRIGPSLALVMRSARWYTYTASQTYRALFREVYSKLRAKTGSSTIDFLQYLAEVTPYFGDQHTIAEPMQPIVEGLHARWHRLFGIEQPTEVKRVNVSVSEIVAAFDIEFAAPGPGWPEGRYHSPDVLVSAAGPDAFARGEFFAVLGETHVGVHSFIRPMFLALHPDAPALIRARKSDIGRPLLKPVGTRANALRTGHYPPVEDDIDIEMGDSRSWRDPKNVIAVADLIVVEESDRLVVKTRDGARSFDVVEALEMYLQISSTAHFSLTRSWPHVPRITIDNLVVSRERWRFDRAQIDFAESEDLDRLVAVKKWATKHGIPRFIFVRVPQEAKPCYVDLESPIYVDLMCKLVKPSSQLDVSEMLPTLDKCWLPDAEGNLYTAELRMAIVDPEQWQSP